ncbi:MAG: hypothetical protein HKP55_10575 [Gammaproteobacteria bacterium]|nr:hypothetical protein [Gammaproteobacteria bacterium]
MKNLLMDLGIAFLDEKANSMNIEQMQAADQVYRHKPTRKALYALKMSSNSL